MRVAEQLEDMEDSSYAKRSSNCIDSFYSNRYH